MTRGHGNADDTEETTRLDDAQSDRRDEDDQASDRNDKGDTPTRDTCEKQAGDGDSMGQGDSDSDTSEDEAHNTQGDENGSNGNRTGVKWLREDRKGRLRRKEAKWAELMRRAQRYLGEHWTRGKCPHQRLSGQPARLTIMETRSMGREERKATMVTLCKKESQQIRSAATTTGERDDQSRGSDRGNGEGDRTCHDGVSDTRHI